MGPLDPDERFVRKDWRPLRNRVDVAAELQSTQIVEKIRAEERFAVIATNLCQVREIVRCEAELLE